MNARSLIKKIALSLPVMALTAMLLLAQQWLLPARAEALSLDNDLSGGIKAELNLIPESQSEGTEAPALKVEVPSVKVELPAVKVETPAVKASIDQPEVDLKDAQVKLPSVKVDTPAVKVELPEVSADLKEAQVVTSPVKVETPVVQVKVPEITADLKEPQAVIPQVKVETPIATVETSPAKVNLEELEVQLPGVKVETPVVNAEIPAISTGPADTQVSVPPLKVETPLVTVETPAVKVETGPGKVNPAAPVAELPDEQAEVPNVQAEIPGPTIVPAVTPGSEPLSSDAPVEQSAAPEVIYGVVQGGQSPEPSTAADGVLQGPQATSLIADRPEDEEAAFTVDSDPAGTAGYPALVKSGISASGGKPESGRDQLPLRTPLEPAALPLKQPAAVFGSGSGGSASPAQGGGSSASGSGSNGAVSGFAGLLQNEAMNMVVREPIHKFLREDQVGSNQWSQAPPGQPPRFASFSNGAL